MGKNKDVGGVLSEARKPGHVTIPSRNDTDFPPPLYHLLQHIEIELVCPTKCHPGNEEEKSPLAFAVAIFPGQTLGYDVKGLGLAEGYVGKITPELWILLSQLRA